MDALVSTTPCDLPREPLEEQFRWEVLSGFSQEQKTVSPRWFYDNRGSELFEQVTRVPEYYPTRTEINILRNFSADVAARVGPGRAVIEFGAGSATKTPLLLDRIEAACYVPIDISGAFLRQSCRALIKRYPQLPVVCLETDFTQPVELPAEADGLRRLGFFPGSTIGNFEPAAAVDLLRAMRATLGRHSMLLIGIDRVKDPHVMIPAYDDAAGVTAAFNLNLIDRINRELGGTIPKQALCHRAMWNPEQMRIEMHLEAVRDISFRICGQPFSMQAGETIHTENSHKFDERSADQLLLAGGWEPLLHYTDEENRFMVFLAQAETEGFMS